MTNSFRSMAGAYSAPDSRGTSVPTGTQTEGDKIRSAAERQYDAIRADSGLTAEGKQKALARVYLDAKAQMNQRRQAARGDVEGDRRRNIRTAFAVPTDAASTLSYRDAVDRANAVNDPTAALTLIERAVDTGDTLLAQALGQRAFDEVGSSSFGMTGSGWGAVLEAYAASRPAVADALNALLNTRAPDMMDLVDFLLSRPIELSDFDVATA